MAERRYEFSLRVLKNISRVSAHSKRNITSPRGHVINTDEIPNSFFVCVKGAINNLAILQQR